MCTIQRCQVKTLGNRLTSYCNYQKDFWSVCMHKLDICMYSCIHQEQTSWEFWLPLLATFCFMTLALDFLFVLPCFPYCKLCCRTHLIKKCLLIVALQGDIVMSRLGFQRVLQKPTSETHFWQCLTHAAAPLAVVNSPHPDCPGLWVIFFSPVVTHGFAKCGGAYVESTLESC